MHRSFSLQAKILAREKQAREHLGQCETDINEGAWTHLRMLINFNFDILSIKYQLLYSLLADYLTLMNIS